MDQNRLGGEGSGLEQELSHRKGLEVRPARAGRLGICQLIDGSMIKGLQASSVQRSGLLVGHDP